MSSRTAFHNTHLDLARGPAIPLTHAPRPGPPDAACADFDSDAAQLLQAGPYHTDHSRLDDALARGAVDLLEADADANESIEGQPVLADLRIGLESLGMPDIAEPDIATIHLGSDYRGSEDII